MTSDAHSHPEPSSAPDRAPSSATTTPAARSSGTFTDRLEQRLMSRSARMLRITVVIVFLVAMIGVYCLILGRFAVTVARAGGWFGWIFALGIVVIPLLGVWMVVSSLRMGYAQQQMWAAARALGEDVDISGLERRPSGRLTKSAAAGLFDQIHAEWESDTSDSWIRYYRLGRAYDYAGDRPRARVMMRHALERYRRLSA